MSLIARLIGSVVGRKLEKHSAGKRQKRNESLGYEGFSKRVNKNVTHFKHLAIHLVVFFGLIIILQFADVSEDFIGGLAGMWAIFILVPHFFATFLYQERWSQKDLSTLTPPEEHSHEKSKRKPKQH